MGLKLRKTRVSRPPMCALTQCMALLRGAWAPNVIWHLREGARRFGELRVDIPLVSAKVLSARLRELQDRGLIERRLLASSPPSAEYALTDLGRELLPAIDAVVRVGRGSRAWTPRYRRHVPGGTRCIDRTGARTDAPAVADFD